MKLISRKISSTLTKLKVGCGNIVLRSMCFSFQISFFNTQGDTSASSSPEIISKSSKSESGDNRRLFFLFLITDEVSSIGSWLSEMSAEAEKRRNFVKTNNNFYIKVKTGLLQIGGSENEL